jgi:hypothetical protein
MVKIEFKIDKEDDINIWYKFINDSLKYNRYGLNRLRHISNDLLAKLKDKPEEEQKAIISKYIEKYYTKEYLNKFFVKSKNKINKNKEEIIKRLERIHNKTLPVNKILIKYETFTCCPYIYKGKNGDFFGLYFAKFVLDRNIECKIFSHELMHLFFHHYFEDYCLDKGLAKKEAMDIKEAVTVILNVELKDIIEEEDFGYPDHVELRKNILKEWKKHKDFKKMLEIIVNSY